MVALNFLITLAAALLPTLIWLVFFLKEDVHPEPRKLLLYTFAIGAIISLPVLATQIIFQGVHSFFPPLLQTTLVLVLGLALIEEVFKFLAAYWAVNDKSAFDEPIDAMIYMITAALGFATIENIFIIGNSFDLLNKVMLGSTLSTILLRFVGATFLHTLSSGLLGYYWARGRAKKTIATSLTFGLILATILHAVFNYLILKFQNTNLLYPSLFLIVALFFILNDFEKLKMSRAKLE